MTWWGAAGLALSLYGAFIVLEWVYGRILNVPPRFPPSVSIVLHVLNQEGVIERAVEDLANLWRDEDWHRNHLEVIIADEGSRDQTAAIVERLQRRYTFMVVAPRGATRENVLDLCRHDVLVWVELTDPAALAALATLRRLLAQAQHEAATVIS